mgnify:CR=1 FL=1
MGYIVCCWAGSTMSWIFIYITSFNRYASVVSIVRDKYYPQVFFDQLHNAYWMTSHTVVSSRPILLGQPSIKEQRFMMRFWRRTWWGRKHLSWYNSIHYVFYSLCMWNVGCWIDILIDGYAHRGNSKETLIHFERKGKKLPNVIIQQRLIKKNIMLSTVLINMYGKCGALKVDEQVFYKLRN